jgi:hypothetical protein
LHEKRRPEKSKNAGSEECTNEAFDGLLGRKSKELSTAECDA